MSIGRRLMTAGGSQQGDPYFSNVMSLLPLTGADGSGIITDIRGHTWTREGSPLPTISTAQGEFGSSLKLNGLSQGISTPTNTVFNFGSGDWTVEASIPLTGYSANYGGYYQACIVNKDAYGGRELIINLLGTASSWTHFGVYGFQAETVYVSLVAPFPFALNTTYRLRVCRSGNTAYLFVNGTLVASGSFAGTLQATTTPLAVGTNNYVGSRYFLPGYIWGVRITKGVARSTASYVPSATPFPTS